MKSTRNKHILTVVLGVILAVTSAFAVGTTLGRYVFSGSVGNFNLTVLPKVAVAEVIEDRAKQVAEQLSGTVTRIVYDRWNNDSGYVDPDYLGPDSEPIVKIAVEEWNTGSIYDPANESIRVFAKAHNGSNYTVYVLSAEDIYAPKNSNGLFSPTTDNSPLKKTVTEMTLRNFYFYDDTDVSNFIAGCSVLKTLNILGVNFGPVPEDMLFGSTVTTLNISGSKITTTKLKNLLSARKSNLTNLIISDATITGSSWHGVFAGCTKLKTLSGLDTVDFSKVTSLKSAFNSCRVLADTYFKDLATALAKGNKVTTLYWAFQACNKMSAESLCDILEALDGGDGNPEAGILTEFEGAFAYSKGLSGTVDLSNVHMNAVTTLEAMFVGCDGSSAPNGIGITHVVFAETSSVLQNISGLFSGCYSLIEADLSKMNTKGVTIINSDSYLGTFTSCSDLVTVYVGDNWSLENVKDAKDSPNMFKGCTSLVGGNGTTYDSSKTNKEYARIDGKDGLKGYFTDINAIPAQTTYSNRIATILYSIEDYNNYYSSLLNQLEKEKPDIYAEMMEELSPYLHVDTDTYVDTGQSFTVLDSFHNIRGKYLHEAYPDIQLPTPAGYLIKCVEEAVKYLTFTTMSASTNEGGQFWINIDYNCSGGVQLICKEPGIYTCYLDFVVDDTRFTQMIAPADMSNFFRNWERLEEVSFAVPVIGATDVSYMFADCVVLKTVDLRGLDFSTVTNLKGMFSGCNSLESVDVTGLGLTVDQLNQMFNGCNSSNLTVSGAPDGYSLAAYAVSDSVGADVNLDGVTNALITANGDFITDTLYTEEGMLRLDIEADEGYLFPDTFTVNIDGTEYTVLTAEEENATGIHFDKEMGSLMIPAELLSQGSLITIQLVCMEDMPVSNPDIPADDTQAPPEGEAPPVDDAQTPPADDTQTPPEGEDPPADDTQTPPEDDDPPVDDAQTPPESEVPPVDDTQTSPEGEAPPVDDTQTPPEDDDPPVDEEQSFDEGEALEEETSSSEETAATEQQSLETPEQEQQSETETQSEVISWDEEN